MDSVERRRLCVDNIKVMALRTVERALDQHLLAAIGMTSRRQTKLERRAQAPFLIAAGAVRGATALAATLLAIIGQFLLAGWTLIKGVSGKFNTRRGSRVSVVPRTNAAFPRTELRPQRLADAIGQKAVLHRLQIAIDAAQKRGEPLGHILFDGPPGLGKTTFALCIAHDLGVGIQIANGAALATTKDLIPY